MGLDMYVDSGIDLDSDFNSNLSMGLILCIDLDVNSGMDLDLDQFAKIWIFMLYLCVFSMDVK